MTIGWNKVSAYVDGELDAQGRAEVAAALARDPDLAARVASLSRLKARVAEVGASNSSEPPLFTMPWQAVANRSSRLRMLFAISVCVGLVLVSVGTLLMRPTTPVLELTALSEAGSMHDVWLGTGHQSTGPVPIPVGLGPRLSVPDLSEAKLKLVYRAATEPNKRPAVFLGYLGPNGCRLGLWIGLGDSGPASRPQAVRLGELAGYVWQNDRLGYAVVAKGMDPRRLASLATVIARIVDRAHGLDGEMHVGLRASATTGTPCS